VSPRTLALLACAALLAGILAVALQREPGGQAEAGLLVLPELGAALPGVVAVEFLPAGREAFRLERGETGWHAPARGSYPANAGELRRLLLRLAEARVLATKTSNPELYDRLGVELEDGEPGSGILLRLEGATPLPALVIGQRETRGLQGTYLRRLDDPAAVLVDQDLQPHREPVDWLERELLDIGPEQVKSLEIVRPDGEILRIDRDELDIFRIANLPEGRQPSGPTAAEASARALAGLRLDDVRPLLGWEPGTSPTVARFVLTDGMIIEARSWQSLSPAEGMASWVALSARAPESSYGEAAARAQEFNERLGQWRFRLPAWKHEQLTRQLDDLLAPAGS
jgi:hypothetical protein